MAISDSDKTAYQEFLVAVLQATSDSDAHQLLAANLDKLNDNLIQVLKAWVTATLAEKPEQARSIIADIGNFSNRIGQFPLGSRSSNLEIAIAGYEVVLGVFTREAFPQDWAMTQNNLGIAYWNRLRGEKAENLEQAIACYQAALQVRTRQAFPENWATTQNNLGIAYSDRLQGERAENLEQAIACYQKALQVLTQQAFPENWAMTQNNLGLAYSNRLRGEKAENLEQAIACKERRPRI